MAKSTPGRGFAVVIALIAWGALVLQYALMVHALWHSVGPWRATLRYFSFFTILSNLLVALTASFALTEPRSRLARLFNSPRLRGIAALCVAVTCGIYFFVLSSLWSPRGAQLLADVLLHYVLPVLYVTWWAVFTEHGRLVWADALRWLLFPLGFLVWTLARGAWVHEYPYPFVNVDALGPERVAGNALGLGALFLIAGFVLVAFDRALRRAAGG